MRFEVPESKYELLRRVGDISQLMGTKKYTLSDGRGRGVECIDVRTGNGFEFTVMPGRGMDIGWCGFEGMPLSYISKVGPSAPSYFSGVKDQWLQCFPGGMLSTCGLSNVGNYCDDLTEGIGVQSFGLHGRISNQDARNICVDEFWDKDDYNIKIKGTVCEAQLRGEKFTLKREISTQGFKSSFKVHDVITNEDFIPRPFMIMYHINFGYPIVDESSEVLIRNSGMRCESGENISQACKLAGPLNGIEESLYFYDTKCLEGFGFAGILNKKINVLAYVKYSGESLPYITQWKMLGDADYVVGLEAGNCIPKGREFHRKNNALQILKPFESVETEMEIGIVSTKDDIQRLLKKERFEYII